MSSDNHIYSLLTNSDENGEDNCRSKSSGDMAEHVELITSRTRDEIRNFIIDELIYRLKDIYPSISNETINVIADEVIATIDDIISEANDFKNIDELIKNEKTYNTLAVVTLMIMRNREVNTIEVSEVDLTQIMKTIIKNTLKQCSQRA